MKRLTWQESVIILAMVTMPISAAINFGAAAYNMLLPRVGHDMALAGGISTGIGFECLGIMAGHYAVTYYGRNDKRWIIAAAVMLAYVIVGSVELWAIPLARFVPSLGAMVYILAGLGSDLSEVKKKEEVRSVFDLEQDAINEDHRRKMAARQQEIDAQKEVRIQIAHKQAVAEVSKAKAKAQASIANAEARKAKVEAELRQLELARAEQERAESEEIAKQSAYVCEDCGRGFATVNALNAHGRVHATASANGAAK